jgi:hypothetical protein
MKAPRTHPLIRLRKLSEEMKDVEEWKAERGGTE